MMEHGGNFKRWHLVLNIHPNKFFKKLILWSMIPFKKLTFLLFRSMMGWRSRRLAFHRFRLKSSLAFIRFLLNWTLDCTTSLTTFTPLEIKFFFHCSLESMRFLFHSNTLFSIFWPSGILLWEPLYIGAGAGWGLYLSFDSIGVKNRPDRPLGWWYCCWRYWGWWWW